MSDASVVHWRRLHLNHAGRSGDLSGLMMAIAHDQRTALLIGQLGYVGVDFGFQRGSQHPPRALPHDLVDRRSTISGDPIVIQSAERLAR
jgi:hypothetical protein